MRGAAEQEYEEKEDDKEDDDDEEDKAHRQDLSGDLRTWPYTLFVFYSWKPGPKQ